MQTLPRPMQPVKSGFETPHCEDSTLCCTLWSSICCTTRPACECVQALPVRVGRAAGAAGAAALLSAGPSGLAPVRQRREVGAGVAPAGAPPHVAHRGALVPSGTPVALSGMMLCKTGRCQSPCRVYPAGTPCQLCVVLPHSLDSRLTHARFLATSPGIIEKDPSCGPQMLL